MKSLRVMRSGPLRGEIEVPGDKSISHRALMLASIAEGQTSIRGLLKGNDNISTLNAFRKMGVIIKESEDEVIVYGKGLYGLTEPDDVIDAGNSGTTIRLLSGLLSGQRFYSVITGDRYLRKRPMMRVVEPLSKMGARIYGREGGEKAPLSIVGSKLKGIDYISPIASAQVKSALLLSGLYAGGVTKVTEPVLSRDHTERMLSFMGARLGRKGTSVNIEGGGRLKGSEIIVPGDISSAAFFIVAALIVEGSELVIRNIGINPTRTGLIDILKEMGGQIEIINEREGSGEPLGDILVKSSRLKGIKIGGEVIPRAIDELPVVAVAASCAKGTTVISGAGELKLKESDRVASVTEALQNTGIKADPTEDGMVIEGGTPRGAAVHSRGDHRVAMSMVVAGLAACGETLIEDTECIDTSFPGFKDILEKVGVSIR